MSRRWLVPGSLVAAVAMVLAFVQVEMGGVPWLELPGTAVFLPGEPVALLTYDGESDACYTDANPFLLVPDPSAGTAMVTFKGSIPVAWPSGFVGRRVGEQINVYSPAGLLVASTGKRWMMAAAPNAESDQYTNPFRIGCAAKGLTQDASSTAPPT